MNRFLLILTIAAATAQPLFAAPAAEFLDQSIRISGIAPGSSIAYVSVSIETAEWMNKIVPRDGLLADADYDGVITIELQVRPAYRSVWGIVDLGSGESVIATPEGFESLPLDPRDRMNQARGVLSSLDAVEIERNELEILLVRPGVGAWRLTAFDGGTTDADQVPNRMIRAALGAMTPLESSGPPPARIAAGDVAIAIDPEELTHFLVRR